MALQAVRIFGSSVSTARPRAISASALLAESTRLHSMIPAFAKSPLAVRQCSVCNSHEADARCRGAELQGDGAPGGACANHSHSYGAAPRFKIP